jgi:hypothetical protein
VTDTTEPVLAWHWLPRDKRLRNRDGRRVRPGSKLSATGRLFICSNGMHASILAHHSLQYAPGPIICRVKLSGEIIHGTDKLCARTREVLWMADATTALWEHALWCAEQALPLWRTHYPNDDRPAKAIEAKRLHLARKISDEELDTARSAAHTASTTAIRCGAYAADAAAYAAYAAAGDLRDVAYSAAKYAARSAAKYAARSAAYAANDDASDSATYDAAYIATQDAQEADLSARLWNTSRTARRRAREQQA